MIEMLPEYYAPEQVGQLYAPRVGAVAEMGSHAGLKRASDDQRRMILLLVDAQIDFIHEDGALSVPGAVADTRRTVEWIYRNIGSLTTIAASLDSHVPNQIFSPTWWVDAHEQHPMPYTVIRSSDVKNGLWRPVYQSAWSIEYVEKLEEQARKELMIWPYHTLIGTPGHSLSPSLYEAIAYHAAARQTQPTFLSKGMIPETEHYSILEPEVKVPSQPMGGLNAAFLNMLAGYDVVYIAGQAKSHCVLETVRSMIRYYQNHAELIRKLHLLIDCMSSVAHPTIDFDAMANETLHRYTEYGLRLVTSADSIV
ncbi:MAG: hypothetical protein SF162_04170 [bacterium]|nr:hypothetical protein [bacterium]